MSHQEKSVEGELKTNTKVPVHIGIIPDGNRRWAKAKGFPTFEGHRKGVENFDRLLYKAREMGIKYVTWWGFSTENWKRSDDERSYLFDLGRELLKRYKQKFIDEKARFIHVGRKDRLDKDIVALLTDVEESTKQFTDFTVAIGVDYGGKDCIVRAVKKLLLEGKEPSDETIKQSMETRDLPPLDLVIRTGGEQRISGFMLWEIDYAEFYFVNAFFPDFGPEELQKSVQDFMNRERRFGGDSTKK